MFRYANRGRVLGWYVTLGAVAMACLIGHRLVAQPPRPDPGGASALDPAAPVVPAAIIAALQEGRFDQAVTALEEWASGPDANAERSAYAALLMGVARRLDGKLDQARSLIQTALKEGPKGPWAVKLRSELATIELNSGRLAEAEALVRAEAEALLAPDRKDRLAGIYEEFAQKLLKPTEPVVPADPEGAHALLEQGRGLAKGPAVRARMLLAMARASQAANNHARAVTEFQAYLSEYAKADLAPADLDAARFGLGEAQLHSGQPLLARLTWEELIRGPKAKETSDFHARAMYWVAQTYGIPNPPDATQLNLGVAALRRFLAGYPSHSLAVRAAFEIAEAYAARGQSQAALTALRAFLAGGDFKAETDEARRELAEKRMTATFRIGQVLQNQKRFTDAVAAYQGYLAQFPNGPQSADAQRAILDTRLAESDDHEFNGRHEEARRDWSEFVAQNPLDGRVPEVLYRIGASHLKEGEARKAVAEKVDEAIAAWELLVAKFPQSEAAGHAQFEVAILIETEKGDPATALERFKKIEVEPWKTRAGEHVAVMERRELRVVTPRAFRSGETAKLKVTTRNLDKLTFTAYKLDPEAYFRKKHTMDGVESLDIGLVAPDAEWTAEVKGFEKYKPIDTTYDLKVAVPGVWVVKVSDERHLQATTLVLGTDIEAIVKASRDQVLVFVQDMKSGQGRANARVLIAQGNEVLLEGKTGPDGVMLKDWAEPRGPNAALRYVVLDGGHAAGAGLDVPETVARGLSARAYLYTDRPAYRPGQTVNLRGVVREVEGGQYAVREGAAYRLEVVDARGRPFLNQPVELSKFGTVSARFALDSSAPLGTYRVRLYQPGHSDFSGEFEVQAYQLQKVDLTFDLPRTVYYRGETVRGAVVAKYQYGTPLSNRPVLVRLPDGRSIAGATDESGRFPFEFPTAAYGEAQTLLIQAALPRDNVAIAARVAVAVLGFTIELETARGVYLDGEPFPLSITTRDALGEAIGQPLDVTVLKRVTREGTNAITEREVSRTKAASSPETGRADVTLKVDDKDGGLFVVRVSGTDRFNNPVVADHVLTISGEKDEERLRILADRQRFKVGEKAEVRLLNRGPKGPALLAWEADRILSYRIVTLNEGENAVGWDVENRQFPNFTLTAARMADEQFHEARLDVEVERDLNVTVKPVKETVGPGEAIEVEVSTSDQLGRPVAAEVSLALVDHALLRLFRDRLPNIGTFFHDQERVGAFTTESTNTFAYHPETVAVSEALVEEAERLAAAAADDTVREDVARRAQAQVKLALPPAPPGAEVPGDAGARFGAAEERGASKSRAEAGMFFKEEGVTERAEGMIYPDALYAGGALGRRVTNGSNTDFFDAQIANAPTPLGFSAGTTDTSGDEAKSKAGAGGARGGRGAVAAPRQAFIETAFWAPRVVTGGDGKAVVKLDAPMALSRYQFAARGTTGADTLVGQATAELKVQKDFFVDLKRPAIVTQGDKPRFMALVHHSGGLKGRATITLKAYAGQREEAYPKTIEIKEDGVDEVLFEPFEVPDGDVVRLAVTARLGDSTDEVVQEVPIRPWGVRALASASGSSSNDATAILGLAPGRTYDNVEMIISLSPTVRRLLIELALGQPAVAYDAWALRCLPVPPDTVTDRASDLLAVGSVLTYLRGARGGEAPESARLTDRARALAGELLTLQNEDGGWPWVAGPAGEPRASDRLASAQASWALAALEPLGLVADTKALDRAMGYLTQQFAAAEASDISTRAALLHALSVRDKATFEQANALNRERQGMPDIALAYLALTFVNLDRANLAGEVLTVLGPRAKTEAAAPGEPGRTYWQGENRHPGLRGATEATALAALAYGRTQPQAREFRGAIAWLTAHRVGLGWVPHKAKGPALAALALDDGKADGATDRYHLVVTVNDTKVHEADVTGASGAQSIVVPRAALKPAGENRVRFDIDGRGTYGYAVAMTGFTRDFGPDQDRAHRTAVLHRRLYSPAEPELDGKPLPTGFGVSVGATQFQNELTQLPLGGRARVRLDVFRVIQAGRSPWEQDFLVVEEHLPAGATLVEGSIQSNAAQTTIDDGTLTFYYAPGDHPSTIQYDVFGYLPGEYRALPAEVRDAYEPGRRHLGPVGELRVLSPGETSTDPYKPTPDELYARGKGLFDGGRLAEAAIPLEALWESYTLRDEVAKDAARMLLFIHLENYEPRKIVRYFEYLRDKSPELVVAFDKLMIVGRAYRDLGEFERAFIVWRGVSEASYLEDARLGELLRQRGRNLEGLALLLRLWREYPNTASIESDFFGLAQWLASLADKSTTEPALRRELADAGKTKSDLLLQAIRLTQVFLSQSPKNPLADEASLALLDTFLVLEDHDAVVKLAERFAKLYPKSTYFDSFQYSAALGLFHLGQYDRAIAIAETIASATYKDANGIDQPSPNKWQALYIIGQIHDARRQFPQAVESYGRVSDRFTDAAEAVKALTRKDLSLPEVTVLRPPASPKAAGGLRSVPPVPAADREEVTLAYRNIPDVDVKVYPVDLMRLYLTRRNLSEIASIDLAGITPLLEKTVKLGEGKDFDDKVKALDLSLPKEGAYLVMARGENLYASGIALVSPLEMEVVEEPGNGRVRVTIRDAVSKAPVPKVLVKVIGTSNSMFLSGSTDLRGVFVAEGVQGAVTAVAKQDNPDQKDAPRYAFHRGTVIVGAPPDAPAPAPEMDEPAQQKAEPPQSLEQNIRLQNSDNRMKQLERLQERYNTAPQGGAGLGGFR